MGLKQFVRILGALGGEVPKNEGGKNSLHNRWGKSYYPVGWAPGGLKLRPLRAILRLNSGLFLVHGQRWDPLGGPPQPFPTR